MGRSIKFNNFVFKNNRVDFLVTTNEEKEYNIFFEINQEYDFEKNQNALALACSTLCGKEYEKIIIDLEITKKILTDIISFTAAEVVCKNVCDDVEIVSLEEKWILNFSGGIDSLAAYFLMPDDTKLVAVDFGRKFEREKKWFEQFNPICVQTNFREEKLDQASWTFMGVGAIFSQCLFNAKYNVFGTILEANPYQFYIGGGNAAISKKTFPFISCGLEDVRITNGLTEIATMMIVGRYKPEILNNALNSLASPGTEKRYRKQCLAKIIFHKFAYDFQVDLVEPPNYKIKFGINLALDFLALYVIKYLGIEEAQKTVSGIPKEYCIMAEEMSLEFYEKYNTNFLESIPLYYREEYLNKLLQAGILPYAENDWIEFRRVVEFLFEHRITKNETKVSVIIPIYNVRDYLETCVESVINQSLSDIEIICVNDGTTDDSMLIIEKFAAKDKRIKIFNKVNGGLSSARNKGLEVAKGEYILFLDSDDWIESDTLQELYDLAKKNNLDNIFFNADVFFESEQLKNEEYGYKNYYKRKSTYDGVYNGRKFCKEIMKKGDFRPSACLQMPKRSVLLNNQIRFYEGIIHEDNLFTIQSLLVEKRVMFIDKTYYNRRMRQNSIVTAEKGVKNAIGYFIVSQEIAKYIGNLDLDAGLRFEIENYNSWLIEKAKSYIGNLSRGHVLSALELYSNDVKFMFMLYIYREAVTKRKLYQEIEDYKNCNSYKVGRVVTFIPRKIIEIIKNTKHKN